MLAILAMMMVVEIAPETCTMPLERLPLEDALEYRSENSSDGSALKAEHKQIPEVQCNNSDPKPSRVKKAKIKRHSRLKLQPIAPEKNQSSIIFHHKFKSGIFTKVQEFDVGKKGYQAYVLANRKIEKRKPYKTKLRSDKYKRLLCRAFSYFKIPCRA